MKENTKIEKAIRDFLASRKTYADLSLKSIDQNFNVTLSFEKPISASVRGSLLLDLEAELNKLLDQRIRLWCEVAHDKSKLRQLRGIKIDL